MNDEDRLLIYSFLDALNQAGYSVVKIEDGTQHSLTERETDKILDEME